MTTPTAHLQKFTKDELIRQVQSLEEDLAQAASGLMKEGSRQELDQARRQIETQAHNIRELIMSHEEIAGAFHRIPRWVRWLFN